MQYFGPLCKLNTVKAIWLKLHALLEHNETMCHEQEPLLRFGYFGVVSHDHLQCYFVSITIRGIFTKLHTFVKHIQTTCHAQEP